MAIVCEEGNSCSKAKLIGFIVYETFAFLWTSQVIGNVALATLAGGPFGSTSPVMLTLPLVVYLDKQAGTTSVPVSRG